MENEEQANLILRHFKELQIKYPEFSLSRNLFGESVARGPLRASAIYKTTEILMHELIIEIILPPSYPNMHPTARETTGVVKDFHTFSDGTLCLGSPLAIKATFAKYRSLVGFLEQLVIPYFFAFKYWQEEGEVPFGELSHGVEGILEYYQELFDLSAGEKVVGLLRILTDSDYRGHLPCPCGSNIILRKCHGGILREVSALQSADEFFVDYFHIVKYLHGIKKSIPKEFFSKRSWRKNGKVK